ncbi:MAG: gamma-glutamyl-gamma-aminobutyrate hydrolase family protein [Nitrospirae bacterium]|nr:gamma-glutamyl-gamma-aminobutyrate hydrolase family protein [Nitrospirota bacterium]
MYPFLILQHVPHEDLGTLRQALENRGIPFRYVRLYAGEKVPDSLSSIGGLILLGGPMNVYQETDYPYLLEVNSLVQEAVRRDLPTLGICLGAQLIAKATGATVYHGKEKEIGWYSLEMSREAGQDSVFAELPTQLTVFQWHGDTFDIPPGGVRLAGSSRFPNQAFRLGERVYALQFHLEVTQEMIRLWIRENQEELSSLRDIIDPGKILQETNFHLPELHQQATVFYDAFFSTVLNKK